VKTNHPRWSWTSPAFLTSTPPGIGALVGAYVNRQKDGRRLLLVGVTPRVRTALQVTKCEQFFQFSDVLPEQQASAS
jgi:anti-anti-sigma regulatory factor